MSWKPGAAPSGRGKPTMRAPAVQQVGHTLGPVARTRPSWPPDRDVDGHARDGGPHSGVRSHRADEGEVIDISLVDGA
jgi:hypothetical protein